MGSACLFITTAIAVIILALRAIHSQRFFRRLSELIKAINLQYKQLFKEKSLIGRMMQAGLLIGAQLFVIINMMISVIRYVDTYLNQTFDFFIKLGIIVIASALIYFLVGYILLMSSKIYSLFYKVEDTTIKIDLLLSYFILSIYFTVLIIFPKQFSSNYKVGIVGVTIDYFLNLKVLIKVIKNPQHIKSKGEDKVSVTNMTVVAVLILVMIILNLFLGVCLINSSGQNAYTGNESYFDLFYYTIITFSTIGYGDIVPLSRAAKIMSNIIATTSVICITVFVSSVLSYKED